MSDADRVDLWSLRKSHERHVEELQASHWRGLMWLRVRAMAGDALRAKQRSPINFARADSCKLVGSLSCVWTLIVHRLWVDVECLRYAFPHAVEAYWIRAMLDMSKSAVSPFSPHAAFPQVSSLPRESSNARCQWSCTLKIVRLVTRSQEKEADGGPSLDAGCQPSNERQKVQYLAFLSNTGQSRPNSNTSSKIS
ncbi:hypothetical protein L1887_55830 [Cichorium endivia]|nr:hypothetical protein L1887_55830 [Cichorium endivia]